MDEKEWSPSTVLDVFGDPIARATLVIASEQRVAVKELADELDVSDPTIYRRIHPLVDANLLKEYQRVDGSGNPRSEYETALESVTFQLDGEGYTVEMEVRQDLADDFDSVRSDLEDGGKDGDPSSRRHSIASDGRRDFP